MILWSRVPAHWAIDPGSIPRFFLWKEKTAHGDLFSLATGTASKQKVNANVPFRTCIPNSACNGTRGQIREKKRNRRSTWEPSQNGAGVRESRFRPKLEQEKNDPERNKGCPQFSKKKRLMAPRGIRSPWVPLGIPCGTHGNPMGSSWGPHGNPMGTP